MKRFRAPGKVVLVGEYAVIDGAPAIVAAIDRGVLCEVSPADRRVAQAPGDTRFVDAALAAVEAPAGQYVFSDWNPPSTATKAGFGGSASATVAAILAGLALAGRAPTPEELFTRGSAVHRAVQGSGSGIDVAAAAHGGVIRFEAGAVRPIAPSMRLQVVWSGQSASTGPRVAAYLAWPRREAFVRASGAIADAFAADPIGALREAHALLASMTATRIDWATPALDRIAALAEARGGAAKPSGAGGGDVAVAILPDPEAEASFLAACVAEGLAPIPVAITRGACEEP